MDDTRRQSSGQPQGVVVALFVGLGAIVAVVLITYGIARPDEGGWAILAGLGLLAAAGVVTVISRAVRRSRE
jgi:hypothetical protein